MIAPQFEHILEQLVRLIGVGGNELPVLRWLEEFAQQQGWQVTVDPLHGCVVGDPAAPVWMMAHVDEVGATVTYAGDQGIHIDGVGRVSPEVFVGRDIEISTSEGVVSGLVTAAPLQTRLESWRDLEVVVDPAERSKIQWGDSLRLSTRRNKTSSGLFASVLDNRLGVVLTLWHALQHGVDDGVAYVFSTQEEIRNLGSIKLLQQYMPEQLVVVDILPRGFVEPFDVVLPKVLVQAADYELDGSVVAGLSGLDIEKISVSTPLLNRSEAMQYEAILGKPVVNYFVPVENYHQGTYFVLDEAVERGYVELEKVMGVV